MDPRNCTILELTGIWLLNYQRISSAINRVSKCGIGEEVYDAVAEAIFGYFRRYSI
jgi:hypothetical protein